MTTTRMGDTIRVLNRLRAEGVIGQYAIAGAVAAYRHVEATLTEGLDLLVSLKTVGGLGLAAIAPIVGRLRELGYAEFRNEGVVIEGWPVQFLPVASALDAEGVDQAEDVEVATNQEGVSERARALRAEHVVATSLSVGRPKDFIRIHQYLEENAVDRDVLRAVLKRHGLVDKWRTFCIKFGITAPLSEATRPMATHYPDTSDILARKAEGRRESARRSFSEKIAIVEALRERVEPLRRARDAARVKSKPAVSR